MNAGEVKLVSRDLDGPNGLALSPDEKYLYVDNWDLKRKVVMRYQVHPDCTLRSGRVFVDLTSEGGEDALDGLKVDQAGNVYLSGPRGVWIFSPEAKHLGTLILPDHPHNFAWGDDDGRTLYLTARSSVYRAAQHSGHPAPAHTGEPLAGKLGPGKGKKTGPREGAGCCRSQGGHLGSHAGLAAAEAPLQQDLTLGAQDPGLQRGDFGLVGHGPPPSARIPSGSAPSPV